MGQLRVRIGRVAALLLLVATAAILRFALLDGRELFRDEAASWLLAQAAWGDIIPRSSHEAYPPLFPYLLKAVIGMLGEGPTALRALPAAAGVAMVAVTWAWAREAVGTRAGFLAALLVALSPLAIANAREARMYSLESLLAVLAWWLLWRLVIKPGHGVSRALTVLGVALAAAGELWTMPTGIAIWALQATVVGILAWRRIPGTGSAAIGLALGFAAFLPWLPRLLSVATDARPFWTPVADLGALLATLAATFGGWQPSPAWIAVPPLAILGAIGFASLFRHLPHDRLATALTITGAAALIPAWWVASLWRPAYDARYLGAAVPALAMVIAVGVEQAVTWSAQRGLNRRTLTGGMAALLLMVGSGTAAFEADWVGGHGQEPATAAAAILQQRVLAGDVVLVADAQTYFPIAYLLERHTDPVRLPAPLRYWRSGREPAYTGGDLIPAGATIGPDASLLPGALPGLSGSGSIWLVALLDAHSELAGFAPLADGRLAEIERIAVSDHGDAGLILRLRPVAARPMR